MPVDYATKCDKNLPEPTISESQWKSLSPEDQWEYVKSEVGVPWAKAYFTCALRHNKFVDWYYDEPTSSQD